MDAKDNVGTSLWQWKAYMYKILGSYSGSALAYPMKSAEMDKLNDRRKAKTALTWT